LIVVDLFANILDFNTFGLTAVLLQTKFQVERVLRCHRVRMLAQCCLGEERGVHSTDLT
jgi:hypothetical protein